MQMFSCSLVVIGDNKTTYMNKGSNYPEFFRTPRAAKRKKMACETVAKHKNAACREQRNAGFFFELSGNFSNALRREGKKNASQNTKNAACLVDAT